MKKSDGKAETKKSERRNQRDRNEHLTMMKPHGNPLSLAS